LYHMDDGNQQIPHDDQRFIARVESQTEIEQV